MEEENNKKKILLVLGIFVLLLMLSVGGVYAYFSARVNNSGSNITGQTLNINGSTLSITATRLNLNPNPTPVSDNLVPAYYGVEPEEMTTTAVNRALSKACVVGGYTGCHVWKIVASTTQNVQNANILLNLSLSNVDDEDEWSYVVYTGTDSSSSAILNSGSISEDFTGNDIVDIHNNGPLTTSGATYYVMVYLNNENSAQNDGVTDNTTDARGAYNGTVTLEAMGGEVKVSFVNIASEYITNLYKNAEKSKATVNNITYNLAPSVNLMNDRHASSNEDINGGDIRYYGSSPNNYVWLGDTYVSSIAFGGGNTEVTKNAGDKKLWRIIGVFDGRLKLVSTYSIMERLYGMSWDASADNINNGYGINEWSQADLMKLLNPGYENNEDLDRNNNTILVNNSLYWNKGTGTVYSAYGFTGGTLPRVITTDVSFANTGLSDGEKNMIDTVTWYLGAYYGDFNSSSYVDVHYAAERQGTSLGKGCSSGANCNDSVTRTPTWEGKVGLMYPSDYAYASDLSLCSRVFAQYTSCQSSNWLKEKYEQWTLSPRSISYRADFVYCVTETGKIYFGNAHHPDYVRPSIYLKPGVHITGGTGTEQDPYVLSY